MANVDVEDEEGEEESDTMGTMPNRPTLASTGRTRSIYTEDQLAIIRKQLEARNVEDEFDSF